jgi:hypothetical protein
VQPVVLRAGQLAVQLAVQLVVLVEMVLLAAAVRKPASAALPFGAVAFEAAFAAAPLWVGAAEAGQTPQI